MNKIEKVVAWLLTITLVFVVIIAVLAFIVNRSLSNAIAVIYYLTTLIIIYPKTPLKLNARMIYAFLSFLIGIVFGLV